MLTFSEWDKIHYSVDESFKEDVQNWLSRTFGGKIDKIDGIISDLVSLERDFAKEWEKSQREIFDLRGKIDSGEYSVEEEREFREKIRSLNNKIESLERLKTQKVRDLNIRVVSLTKGNSRVAKYWNLKKAEAEVEVAENLYNISKNLPDRKMEDDLYKRYLKSYEILKDREKQVDDLVHSEEEREEKPEVKEGLPEIQRLVSMSIPKFAAEIKGYSKADLKKIQRALIDRKNSGLNELRSLRRSKAKESDKVSPKERGRVAQKFNPMIYELGEIIDNMREKISYIDKWTI